MVNQVPIAVRKLEEDVEYYVVSSALLADLAPTARPPVVARRSAQPGAGAFSKPHDNVP